MSWGKLFLILLFQGHWVFAVTAAPPAMLSSIPTEVVPAATMDMNNFVMSGTTTRSSLAPFVINVHLSCFKGLAIRYSTNATVDSNLRMTFSLRLPNSPQASSGSIAVVFPAPYVGKFSTDNPQPYLPLTTVSGPGSGGVRASIVGNLLRIEVPAKQVTIDPTNPSSANIPSVRDDLHFETIFRANQKYSVPTKFDSIFNGALPELVPAPIATFSHIYQGVASYSTDIDVAFPAGSQDLPMKSSGKLGPLTNVLDCNGALVP